MDKRYLAIIIGILLCLEVLTRAFGLAPKLHSGYDVWMPHSYFGFITQPNIERIITLPNDEAVFEVRHNSLGFRDSEPINPRVLFLGDSFTYGWGVGQGETFTELIENSLSIEIMNAGVPGYWPEQEVLLLDWLPYHFDHIFMCITPSDIVDTQKHIKANSNGCLVVSGEGILQHIGIVEKIYRASHFCRIMIKAVSNYIILKETEADRERFAEVIKDFSDDYNGVVIIINAPGEYRLPDLVAEQIFINLPKDYYFDEGHINQKGHRTIAELVGKWIENKTKKPR